MADEQIKLNKKVYGNRSAKDLLNRDFKEFFNKKYQTDELFNIYDALFYDISLRGTNSHSSIVK
jgi:inorganic pyrophosphatase/exopolyphosphatase